MTERASGAWDRALGAALEATADELVRALPSGTLDDVERALAEALGRASSAGQWDVVRSLAAELEARRRAHSGVLELDAARARRGRV